MHYTDLTWHRPLQSNAEKEKANVDSKEEHRREALEKRALEQQRILEQGKEVAEELGIDSADLK